jgi:hypothetical protein
MNARIGDPSSPQLAYVANTPQAYWLDQAFPAGSVTGVVLAHRGGPSRRRDAAPGAVRDSAPGLRQLRGRRVRLG